MTGDRQVLEIEVTALQLQVAGALLRGFNPEWDEECETLQNLVANILGREVLLRLSTQC